MKDEIVSLETKLGTDQEPNGPERSETWNVSESVAEACSADVTRHQMCVVLWSAVTCG